MNTRQADEVRQSVRQRYAGVARSGNDSCGATKSCCPGPSPDAVATRLGYSDEELGAAPAGANLGLGCGNPGAIAGLKPGETVLDLGSGGGFDCFLAGRQVGDAGRVIGVDMTPEMVALARENARKSGVENVEFRLGEIEHLPVADRSVDVILSNCVINLSPDKPAVYREAFRVLRPGGRIAISDVVALADIPEDVRNDLDAHSRCIAGAARIEVLQTLLEEIGFQEVSVHVDTKRREIARTWEETQSLADYVAPASIEARKPAS